MHRIIGVNDTANQVNLATQQALITLNPSDTLDTFVNDEFADAAIANVAASGMTYRVTHVLPGEQASTGRLAVAVTSTISNLNPTGLAGKMVLYLTASGLLTTINGMAGGYDGREIAMVNKTGNALNVVQIGHLAGNPTPATSRFFTQGLGLLGLPDGGCLNWRYHGGDGLWYRA